MTSVGDSFAWPFQDPGWFGKMVVQGLIFIIPIVGWIAMVGWFVMTSIITFATYGLGCVLSLFLVFGWVGILALHVVAILKGLNGGRLIVPVVSDYANRF